MFNFCEELLLTRSGLWIAQKGKASSWGTLSIAPLADGIARTSVFPPVIPGAHCKDRLASK